MTTADKVARVTSQLIGDISRLGGVTLDQAGEAQLAQLIIDAFEAVGHIALGQAEEGCNCGPEQRCPVCLLTRSICF